MTKRLSKNQQRALARKKLQKTLRSRFNVTESKPIERFAFLNTRQFALASALSFILFAIFGAYFLNNLNQGEVNEVDTEINRASAWQKLHKPQLTDSDSNINPQLQSDVTRIVKNTPMAAMVNEISQRDRAVAAYLVGIAMKESKFGKFSPKKEGTECYNYWGYRGKENTTKSGYSCFKSPQHAIAVVGDKIAGMLKKGSKKPAEMISWKCGSSCAGHDPESVRKWIADVAINYYKLNPDREVARNK